MIGETDYCEDCGADKDSVVMRVDGQYLCDACEDVAEIERAVRGR